MKVSVMIIAIGTLPTISKSLVMELEELEIGGQSEILQTIKLLRLNRILWKSWKGEETCSDSESSKKKKKTGYDTRWFLSGV